MPRARMAQGRNSESASEEIGILLLPELLVYLLTHFAQPDDCHIQEDLRKLGIEIISATDKMLPISIPYPEDGILCLLNDHEVDIRDAILGNDGCPMGLEPIRDSCVAEPGQLVITAAVCPGTK